MNRLIEVRYPSVFHPMGRAARWKKGATAEAENPPVSSTLVRRRTSAGLSHSLWSAIRESRDSVSVFPGPLWQSGSFLILPAGGGNSRNERKGKIMKKILALVLALTMALTLAACGGNDAPGGETTGTPTASAIPGLEDGVLTVGMECAYAPYNWTQMDDSNGAVPIANNPGSYANGYDIMIAQKICEVYGWKLEVMALEWGGLSPALAAGTIDVAIAGQSMTAERMAEVDMAGPYYYATIVCVTTANSPLASATSIADLSGTCTSQSGTIWYDTCLPQIPGAELQSPADSAPAMIMALESGMVDFICTDLPTANGAVAKNPNLVVLNFAGTDGDFQFASEEIRAENVNIGVSVKKGNSELQKAMNDVLNAMTEADFNALMDSAIAIQPAI